MTPQQLAMIQADIADFHMAFDGSRLAGKRLLITGAGGYLASYMADTVAWLNDQVLAVPCQLFLLVRSPVREGSRLHHLRDRADVTVLYQDVRQPIMNTDRMDFIVHAASPASPRQYLQDPLGTLDANIIGTRHLLEMAKNQGVESVLYFSSSEIYGNIPPTMTIIPETFFGQADTLAPRACYTEAKRVGETLCMVYHRQYGLPVNIVRPFHVYGCGQPLDDGRVVADFLRNRLSAEPIRLLSDGSGVRSFTYIADAVMGYWQVLLADAHGEAYNIGEEREIVTIRTLAETVAALETPTLDCYFEAERAAHLQGTPSRAVPSIEKARLRLGYQPRYTLDSGLRRTLAWYRS